MTDIPTERRVTGEQPTPAKNGWKLPLAVVVALVGAAVSFGVWKGSVVTDARATKLHEPIMEQIIAVEKKADKAVTDVQAMSRDVRTIKCVVLAPNNRAKARCALGE